MLIFLKAKNECRKIANATIHHSGSHTLLLSVRCSVTMSNYENAWIECHARKKGLCCGTILWFKCNASYRTQECWWFLTWNRTLPLSLCLLLYIIKFVEQQIALYYIQLNIFCLVLNAGESFIFFLWARFSII